MKTTLSLGKNHLQYIPGNNEAIYFTTNKEIQFNILSMNIGKLFFNSQGYFFQDNYQNFYDEINSIIYFNNGSIFEGDKEKEGFSLFDNNFLVNQNIELSINRKNNERRIDLSLENIYIDLIGNLKSFDLKNVKLKNGKFIIDNIKDIYYILNEDETSTIFENKIKVYEGQLSQIIKNNSIYLVKNGKGKSFKDSYEGEYLLNSRIGKGKFEKEVEEKFFFFGKDKIIFEKVGVKDNIKQYKVTNNEYLNIILEFINNNICVKITVKDIESQKTYYEINANLSNEHKLDGNGFVRDYKTGSLYFVNFNTNNIITNDLNNLQLQNKNFTFKEKYENTIEDILKNENEIEKMANIRNIEDMEEKINRLNTQYNSKLNFSVYMLSGIIYMSNSRKYGRDIEYFENIYRDIILNLKNLNQTDIDSVMKYILPNYALNFQKVENKNNLKDFIKRGIKCLAFFNENQFKKIFPLLDKSIQEELKKNYVNKNGVNGALILMDIDDNDNYVFITNLKTVKNKKYLIKVDSKKIDAIFYAVYFYESDLTRKEKIEYQKLKDFITRRLKLLLNTDKIKCPKCETYSSFELFNNTSKNIFICPSQKHCKIEMNSELLNKLIYESIFNENK